MSYRSLRECINDLERTGQLVRIPDEVDPHLEAAEIHRRVYDAGGPAILFERVAGCRFPMVSNLFGTIDRARYLFRDTLDGVRRLVELKVDPAEALRHPLNAARARYRPRGRCVRSSSARTGDGTHGHDLGTAAAPVLARRRRRVHHAAAGLHRRRRRARAGAVRTSACTACSSRGGEYEPDREIGLHYQIHRGIGVHHAAADRDAASRFA